MGMLIILNFLFFLPKFKYIMKPLYPIFSILISSALLISCGNGQKQTDTFDRNEILNSNDRVDASSVYNSGDTAEVMRLTKEYLEYLKGSNYEAAISMLSQVNDSTVTELEDAQAKRMMRNMRLFPVENYSINDVRFYSDNDTEVSYTINQTDVEEGPSTVMKCMLCFRKVDGKWYATVIDTDYSR